MVESNGYIVRVPHFCSFPPLSCSPVVLVPRAGSIYWRKKSMKYIEPKTKSLSPSLLSLPLYTNLPPLGLCCWGCFWQRGEINGQGNHCWTHSWNSSKVLTQKGGNTFHQRLSKPPKNCPPVNIMFFTFFYITFRKKSTIDRFDELFFWLAKKHNFIFQTFFCLCSFFSNFHLWWLI